MTAEQSTDLLLSPCTRSCRTTYNSSPPSARAPSLLVVVDLFNNLNLFYSVVTEFCTVENNPTMSAGPG